MFAIFFLLELESFSGKVINLVTFFTTKVTGEKNSCLDNERFECNTPLFPIDQLPPVP